MTSRYDVESNHHNREWFFGLIVSTAITMFVTTAVQASWNAAATAAKDLYYQQWVAGDLQQAADRKENNGCDPR